MYKLILATCFFGGAIICKAQQSITWKYLDSIAQKRMQVMSYGKTEDTILNIYYIKPTHVKPADKQPAVIWIHGGAWVGGKANTFFANAAYSSLKGTIGISIEYRLINNAKKDITQCIEDCKNAIEFIKSKAQPLNIDTNKIVLIGESAGGHLAACMAMNKPNRTTPYALVLYNPVLNCSTSTFIKFMDASVIMLKNKKLDTIALFEKYRDKAIKISPLFQVKQKFPPTLVLNGLEDKITPAEYAIAFTDSINRFSNNCELILLPNTSHAFAIAHYKSTEQQVIDALLKADEFLTRIKIFSSKYPIKLQNSFDINWIQKF
jgi:acetyl esterase